MQKNRAIRPGFLLNMGVIADMIFAIAVISLTTGTVAEFKLWVGNIRSIADSTFMGIVLDGHRIGAPIGLLELKNFSPLRCSGMSLFFVMEQFLSPF